MMIRIMMTLMIIMNRLYDILHYRYLWTNLQETFWQNYDFNFFLNFFLTIRKSSWGDPEQTVRGWGRTGPSSVWFGQAGSLFEQPIFRVGGGKGSYGKPVEGTTGTFAETNDSYVNDSMSTFFNIVFNVHTINDVNDMYNYISLMPRFSALVLFYVFKNEFTWFVYGFDVTYIS